MTTGWWKLRKDLDPHDCLTFPNDWGENGMEFDREKFDKVVEATIPLNDCDIEYIVGLVKQGYVEGQVVQ